VSVWSIWNVAAQPPASQMLSADGTSRGINGKRKLPAGCPPGYSSVSQFTNFAGEKRHCRPDMQMQKQEPNYMTNSFAGFIHCHIWSVFLQQEMLVLSI